MKDNISEQELSDFLGLARVDGLLALEELNLSDKATILDIGTGAGISAVFFAQNGYQVVTSEPETDDSEYVKMDWKQMPRDTVLKIS
ncbi:MAG: hypothetical protein AAFQ94_21165 [Bacteroidota bacterium]